jgi:hypothetical protein
MPWILRWIVDLFNSLAARYYRRKYAAAARHLGRPPQEEDGRAGFIIVEIDGLAYHYLRQAIKQGYMPCLARLLTGRKLRLARWRCGLPSTTPASQAGILYGNNWNIPGFRWYDKQAGSSVQCKLPGSVRAIQERISAGRAGLLRGGSSYTNMFDGDARLALFTLSALGRNRLLENVRGFGFLVLFGLSPLRTLRILGLSLWTGLVYVAKRVGALLRPSSPHFRFLGPLLEILNNVIFREVTTFSVMVDIYRGMPAIYAAYTGYDEIAHHFGADSREAFRALRGIDKQIRQIDRIRQLYRRRHYDLYVLSDHGMTPAISFRTAFGQTLEEWIAAHTGHDVSGPEVEGEELPAARAYFLLDEIQGLEARSLRLPSAWHPRRRLLQAIRRRLEEELDAERAEAEWDLSRRDDVVVRCSGSLAHVYCNVTPHPLDLSEVAVLYPGLLEGLLGHAGIGLVAGREGDQVVMFGPEGTLWVGGEQQRQEGLHPLVNLPDPAWAAGQVARVARFPQAGDLILLGAWDGERVVTFEHQVATHGGLGGPQDWPFMAFPPQRSMGPRAIQNAEEVYTRLVQTYGVYE